MSTSRPRRISRRTAEQLLRGARAGQRGVGPDAMADLLAAAAAPARADELAGRPAALAAFRSAQLGPVPQLRRRSVIKSALATSLTAKIAAVAVVAVSCGGIATAAVTGYLPAHPGPASTPAPAGHTTETPGRPSTVGSGPVVGVTSAAERGSGDRGHAAPAPDLVGLCHAYTAGAGGGLRSPAFAVLVDTAGGEAKVSAYCATLLRGQKGKPPSKGAPGTGHGGAQHPGANPSHATGA